MNPLPPANEKKIKTATAPINAPNSGRRAIAVMSKLKPVFLAALLAVAFALMM